MMTHAKALAEDVVKKGSTAPRKNPYCMDYTNKRSSWDRGFITQVDMIHDPQVLEIISNALQVFNKRGPIILEKGQHNSHPIRPRSVDDNDDDDDESFKLGFWTQK